MASELIGNQPLGGTVSTEIGVLFKNLGNRTVEVVLLEFANDSGTDDVRVEVYQFEDSQPVKIAQAVLDIGETLIIEGTRRFEINNEIAARASVANTIKWRANIRNIT